MLALWAVLASAQDPAPKLKSSPAAAAPAPPQVAKPDAKTILLLLRTTLLTLNHALQTGNFTVLRDMAAPGFREANSAARLAGIFANLIRQQADLAAVAILAPQLNEAPTLDPKTAMLRIKGNFPTQSGRLDFELLYQPVAGHWRLFGIAVQPTTVASDTAKGSGAGSASEGVSKFTPSKGGVAPTRSVDPKGTPAKK